MKKIGKIKYSLILILCAISFCIQGCDVKVEKKQDLVKSEAPDAKIVEKLNAVATTYFQSNDAIKDEWVKQQLEAYKQLNSYMPDIEVSVFARMRAIAEAKYPDVYTDRLKFLKEEVFAFAEKKRLEKNMPSQRAEFINSMAEKHFPDQYVRQLEFESKWNLTFKKIEMACYRCETDDVKAMVERIVNENIMNPNLSLSQIEKQIAAKRRVDSTKHRDATEEEIKIIKDKVVSDFPSDFIGQENALKKAFSDIDKALDEIEASKAPLSEKSESIFRESIFTVRGAENDIFTAALVKLNGKIVVLCSKEFLQDTIPVKFGNSRGTIVCSKAFVSKEFSVVMMIPDVEPTGFTPIEIVDAKDSQTLADKPLFMIAPHKGGFTNIPVSVFSEDLKFLNLTSDTSPDIEKNVEVKPIDKYGKRLMVSITETVDVGDNSVIIDPESGKLVSLAVRIFNPGVLSWTGKTGSIIGHEKSEIPDFANFVRQFDGSVNKTYKPNSSIRFIRMTALENWKPLDMKTLAAQKNTIRLFTDDNNDFMMFFKKNRYEEALKSKRLGMIAEKYRKTLTIDKVERSTYERNYKGYMLDILQAMRREMDKYKNADEFYSIYKNEMNYQIKFRKAMYDYLAEGVKDVNIINILHTDLVSRYNNTPNTERIGGSTGGGL